MPLGDNALYLFIVLLAGWLGTSGTKKTSVNNNIVSLDFAFGSNFRPHRAVCTPPVLFTVTGRNSTCG